MSTPTPPTPPASGGDQPTTAIPQTPPTGPAYPGAAPAADPGAAGPGDPGTPAPVPADHGKNKALPWQIATGVLALTTIGFGIWGFNTNSTLNNLQSSTDQQITALQQQLKDLEAKSGAKEAAQAKEIASYRAKSKKYKGELKVDTTKIKQETAEIAALNTKYQKAQANAQAKENNLAAQLKASQAESALAKKCASVMANGLLKIYQDVATVVTYKEVDAVLKEASATCGDVINVNVP